jgi:hypothetical protein
MPVSRSSGAAAAAAADTEVFMKLFCKADQAANEAAAHPPGLSAGCAAHISLQPGHSDNVALLWQPPQLA